MFLPNINSVNITTLSLNEFDQFFNEIDSIIFDCDGVLWVEDAPVEGSVETFNYIKSSGKNVLMLSNNSTIPRSFFIEKAQKMGFDIDAKSLITTSYLLAIYLKRQEFTKKVYVVGSKGITDELDLVGIKHLGYGPDNLQHSLAQTIENFTPDPDVGAVIVGFDPHFSYTKLLKAATYLNDSSCIFLATNKHVFYTIDSLVMPGTGAILSTIEAVAQRKALIIGKPYEILGNLLQNEFKIMPAKTLIVGDRSVVDIKLGNKCGFLSLLVKSGYKNFMVVDEYPDDDEMETPTYFINKLGDLLPMYMSINKSGNSSV